MRLLTSSFQRKSITHTNTNKLLCEQKNSSTSFSLQLKHLVTTLLKPKNEDCTFSSCLKHIFFHYSTLPSLLVHNLCNLSLCSTFIFMRELFLSANTLVFYMLDCCDSTQSDFATFFFAKAKLSLPSFSNHKLTHGLLISEFDTVHSVVCSLALATPTWYKNFVAI